MQEATSKEKILKRVRKALIQSTPQPFPNVEATTDYYDPPTEELEVIFAREFSKIQGKFLYCENLDELKKSIKVLANELKLKQINCWHDSILKFAASHNLTMVTDQTNLEKADAGLTLCEALVARTGSVLLSSAQAAGLTLSIFPPVHFIIAFPDQIVFDIKEGIEFLAVRHEGNQPSFINLNTGPSRTADIEKTLVLGAHGPKEVFLFLVDEKL